MLVLSRKKGQSVIINDNIEITVFEIQGDQVKLGINAPKNVAIHRKEVYEEIQQENKAAAGASADSLKNIQKLIGRDKK